MTLAIGAEEIGWATSPAGRQKHRALSGHIRSAERLTSLPSTSEAGARCPVR